MKYLSIHLLNSDSEHHLISMPRIPPFFPREILAFVVFALSSDESKLNGEIQSAPPEEQCLNILSPESSTHQCLSFGINRRRLF